MTATRTAIEDALRSSEAGLRGRGQDPRIAPVHKGLQSVWIAQAAPTITAPGGDPAPQYPTASIPAGSGDGGSPAPQYTGGLPHSNLGDSRAYAGVSAGDLVHFRGPGDSSFSVTVTQVTQGHVIGEFAGQTISFPTSSLQHVPVPQTPVQTSFTSGPGGGGKTLRGETPGFSRVRKADVELTRSDELLIKRATNRYGGSPDDANALYKALESVAFGAPGMRSAVQALQAKIFEPGTG